MSCTTTNSPIDVNIKNSSGICDLKCDYKFNYHSSTCSVTNRGDYLSISYDDKSASSAPVHYNTYPYNVSEIRIYTPSLHSFNGGNKASGEIIIIHNPVKGGNQLLVCVPIRLNSQSTSPSSNILDKIINSVAKNAQNDGDSLTIPMSDDVFTLNSFIPNAPFFSYTAVAPYSPCTDNVTLIVFDTSNTKAEFSNVTDKLLSTIINSHSYDTKTGTPFFYNKGGSKTGVEDGEIYIDCRPVGSSTEQTSISKKLDNTSSNQSTPWWETPEIQDTIKIIAGIVIFGVVILVFIYFFNGTKKSNISSVSTSMQILDTKKK